jgi:hypothetical protein
MVIGVILKVDLQGTWFRRADYFWVMGVTAVSVRVCEERWNT